MKLDGLPKWRKASRGVRTKDGIVYGYTSGDHKTDLVRIRCALAGFDLVAFDEWLSTLEPGEVRAEVLAWRAHMIAVANRENGPALRLCLGLDRLTLTQWGIERERFLLPLARTGNKVRKPFAESNDARMRKAAEKREDWRRRAARKWTEPQHRFKSAAEIARLIARDGENPDTIRRHISRQTR